MFALVLCLHPHSPERCVQWLKTKMSACLSLMEAGRVCLFWWSTAVWVKINIQQLGTAKRRGCEHFLQSCISISLQLKPWLGPCVRGKMGGSTSCHTPVSPISSQAQKPKYGICAERRQMFTTMKSGWNKKKRAPELKRWNDLPDDLDKVLWVLRGEASYVASARLQRGSMGHNQDRVSCVKEAENRVSHSTDTISFPSRLWTPAIGFKENFRARSPFQRGIWKVHGSMFW